MKRIISISFVLLGFVLLFSCEDDKEITIFDPNNATAPQLIVPTVDSNYVLDQSIAEDTIFYFEWTPADFGFNSPVSYKLQMDVANNDFANAVDLVTSFELSANMTVGAMNALLAQFDLVIGDTNLIEFRVKALFSEDEGINSDPVAVGITPYKPFSETLYVALSLNDINENTPIIVTPTLDGIYLGYAYFDDATEMFIIDQTNEELYGDDGSGSIAIGGTAIAIAEAGIYRIALNLNDNSYEFLKQEWGLIGSATPDGWNSDQDMTYDPATRLITITEIILVTGEFKFRPNDSWEPYNYGDDGTDGTMEDHGANIPLPEDGNYTISMDLFQPPVYTYSVVKN